MNTIDHDGHNALPLEVPSEPGCPLSAKRQQQFLWALILLGLAARAVRYFLKFPLWDDECFLMANMLERGYGELAEPLNYWQICPVGFLWLELSVAKLFGFCEYALRLPSFVCGVAGLFVFRRLAGRLFSGTALLLSVGIFAVAYPLIRYSAEAKPYGIDMFLALAFYALAVEWWTRGANSSRWLWAMTALTPPAVFISYPLVFVAGGISLFVAYVLLTTKSVECSTKSSDQRERVDSKGAAAPLGWRSYLPLLYREAGGRGWLAWIAFNLALLATFAAVLLISIQPQSSSELTSMRSYWDRGFPPLAQPLALIAWFFKVHTGQMLAYPIGGNSGGSILTFIFFVTGLAVLLRRRQTALLVLCLAPLALTFIAAAVGRYPYGGMVRFNIYMAPIICLLAGAGLAGLSVPRRWRAALRGRAAVTATVAVLMLVAMMSMARDVAFPAKAAIDMRFRDFARWFWFDMAHDGELVCLKSDLGMDFSPETFRHGFSAMYLCNQRIYSPRHARGERPHLQNVSAEWPLRCVQFRSSLYDFDKQDFQRWLASMQQRYELIACDSYPFACYDKRETTLRAMTYVDVYKFIPKQGSKTGPLMAKKPTLKDLMEK